MSARDEYAAEDQEEEDSYSDEIEVLNGNGGVHDDENGNNDDDFNGDPGKSTNGASSPPISSESGIEVD